MLKKFIDENLLITEEFIKIPAVEIYERYLSFCKINNLEALTKIKFNRELVLSGLTKDRGTGNALVFSGVYLTPCKY